ncbi:MAG: peptidoglycan DD-metalloendopeptidase family protein [Litorivicinus sp.]
MIRYFPRKHLTALTLLCATVTALALVPSRESGVDTAEVSADRVIIELPPIAADTVASAPRIKPLASEAIVTPTLPVEDAVSTAIKNLPDLPSIQPDVASLEIASVQKTKSPEPVDPWQTLTVKSGDSMSALFQRAGLSSKELYRITSADKKRRLYKIMPGQRIRVLASDGRVEKLEYLQTELKTYVFDATGDSVTVDLIEKKPEIRLAHATGTIKGSLFYAGKDAGLSERQTMNLANIFGHVINFVYDLRAGDHFHVVYEEQFLEGKKIGEGRIVAAEFTNSGERFSAYRYEDSEGYFGYYDEDGTSMRKAFLLAPLNYSRISSNFKLARKHPVLGKVRAHKGTDYAAPTGTPIYASGDGRVSFSGTKGGYGKTVIIKHAGGVETRYAHMSRIAAGSGKRVRQGQVIGYVGATGLATGPHLHYEFILNGAHRNPRTVLAKLPKAKSLPKSELARFKSTIATKVALIEGLRQTQVARLESSN